MRLIASLAALLIAGCQTAAQQTTQPASPVTLNEAQTLAIQDGVRRQLKDPESARFANIQAVRDTTGLIIACGYVNSRNSFGGYTGNSPFMAGLTTAGDAHLIGLGEGDAGVSAVLRTCSRQGVPL